MKTKQSDPPAEKPKPREAQLPKPMRKAVEFVLGCEQALAEGLKEENFTAELDRRGISFDLYATIAARLLTGDDFEKAAKRALRLLDSCRLHLRVEAVKRLRDESNSKVAVHFSLPAIVPYDLLCRMATGETRKDRAEEKFVEFIKSADCFDQNERAEFVGDLKKGVSRATAIKFARCYQEWDLGRVIPRLVPRLKKSFDSGFVGKSAKRPVAVAKKKRQRDE